MNSLQFCDSNLYVIDERQNKKERIFCITRNKELLNQKCTERWKTMSEKEKRWFIYLEIEGRKSSSYSSRRPDPYPSHKTSTPISKIEQAIGFKKRFNSGGTRKL